MFFKIYLFFVTCFFERWRAHIPLLSAGGAPAQLWFCTQTSFCFFVLLDYEALFCFDIKRPFFSFCVVRLFFSVFRLFFMLWGSFLVYLFRGSFLIFELRDCFLLFKIYPFFVTCFLSGGAHISRCLQWGAPAQLWFCTQISFCFFVLLFYEALFCFDIKRLFFNFCVVWLFFSLSLSRFLFDFWVTKLFFTLL